MPSNFFTVQLACFSYLNDQDQHLPAALNWHQFHFLTIAMERSMPRRQLGGCAGQLFVCLLFFYLCLCFCSSGVFLPLLCFTVTVLSKSNQTMFAVGLGTEWIMASQSSTRTRIWKLSNYFWYAISMCWELFVLRYGPIAYKAVVAVAGCAPDPELKAQVGS